MRRQDLRIDETNWRVMDRDPELAADKEARMVAHQQRITEAESRLEAMGFLPDRTLAPVADRLLAGEYEEFELGPATKLGVHWIMGKYRGEWVELRYGGSVGKAIEKLKMLRKGYNNV